MSDIDVKELALQLAKKKAELDKEILDASKTLFRDAALQLFKKYQDLKRFSWVQYTDYFNDGEPLVFRVYTDEECICLNDEESYWENGENDPIYHSSHWKLNRPGWFLSSYNSADRATEYVEVPEDEVPWEAKARRDISLLLQSLCKINREILKDSFGDHVSVTVYPEGVSIQGYSDHE